MKIHMDMARRRWTDGSERPDAANTSHHRTSQQQQQQQHAEARPGVGWVLWVLRPGISEMRSPTRSWPGCLAWPLNRSLFDA